MSVYGNINYQRDMVTLRTAWIRNSPLPLSPDEALAKNLITTETQTTTTPVECSCGMGPDAPMSQHYDGCPCKEGYQQPDLAAGLVADEEPEGQPEKTGLTEGGEQEESPEHEASETPAQENA